MSPTKFSWLQAASVGLTAFLLLVANVAAAPVIVSNPHVSRQFFGHVPSTVVRVKTYLNDGTMIQCSGVVIDTPTKNIVVTAAHCLYSQFGLVREGVVEPGFDNNTAPFGQWEIDYAIVPQQWLDAHNEGRRTIPYDHAFMVMKPNKDCEDIVDVAGGSRLVADMDPAQDDVIAWGYPSEEKYGTRHAIKCHDNAFPDEENASSLPCEMTDGASGGPWFVNMTDANTGLVYTLGVAGDGPDNARLFYGQPFPQGFVDLVNSTPCRTCNTY